MIPLGVIWAGYTLIWYGYSNIKNWGIGLTDLIKPSAVAKVDAAIAATPTSSVPVSGLKQANGSLVTPTPNTGSVGESFGGAISA